MDGRARVAGGGRRRRRGRSRRARPCVGAGSGRRGCRCLERDARAGRGRSPGPPAGAALIAGTWQGGTPLHAETDDRALVRDDRDEPGDDPRLAPRALARDGRARARERGRDWFARRRAPLDQRVGVGVRRVEKAAVVALAEIAAAEVRESGVRVNAILLEHARYRGQSTARCRTRIPRAG